MADDPLALDLFASTDEETDDGTDEVADDQRSEPGAVEGSGDAGRRRTASRGRGGEREEAAGAAPRATSGPAAVAHPPEPDPAETPSDPADAADPAAAPEPDVWTVSQVNRAVKNLLEGTLPALWVSGEIGGWTKARSGHRYFTLKDDSAQLRCVMWRTDAARLPTDPDEGMEVRVHGNLTLYEARGEYQMQVRKLEAAGAEGLWKIAFEKLRKKLEAEGLLAAERKRPLPRFPRTVGVVTSTSGAALRDVLSVIGRRAPWTRVVVRGARVQGEGASLEVAEAVRALGDSGLVEVMIVGRGGGSIEDLWAFNEEPVARAIARSPVPVISAVGHETDVTIADLVADLRAPTPSAGAEAAVQDGAALQEGLRRLPERLSRALRNALDRREQRLRRGRERLGLLVGDRLRRRRDARERLAERLERAARRGVERRRERLRALAGRLDALSPLSTLKRGYAVPLDAEGHVLRGVADFEPDEVFRLRVADGSVRARTEKVLEEDAVDAGNALDASGTVDEGGER